MPTIEELEPLLTVPAEALDVEYKGWLDLRGDDEHKAVLAKAAIAIANEGGGYIVIGVRENRPNLISEPRPAGIAAYDQDLINQIIRRFASPQFHCMLTMLRHPESGHELAVVSVPGGHGFPVMSKSGTQQNTIKPHLCYMRKPGPESAPPENHADWERLLMKCLRNRREDMLDAIRGIVEGKAAVAAAPQPTDAERQAAFAAAAYARWAMLVAGLDQDAQERCPLGRYELDYALLGDFDQPSLADLLEMLRQAVGRHSSWPEFWVPTRRELEPVVFDDAIDCWIGAPFPERGYHDSAHADFWRASPQGRTFLLRGYAEDSAEILAGQGIEPGTTFDVTMPTLRIGECLLHAASLASLIAPGRELRVLFRMRWYGLAGRRITSIGGTRMILAEHVSRQDEYGAEITIDVARIADNLPEIVYPLLAPLYERFGFLRLPATLPAEELARMRANRF